jgi:ribose transport system substrate-binding protein
MPFRENVSRLARYLRAAVAASAVLAPPGAHADTPEVPPGGAVAALANGKGHVRIVFLAFQNNPFWKPVTDGALAAKAYLRGFNASVDYVDMGGKLSAEAVVAGIEAALAQRYDGIVVVPVFDGTARIINEAVDAGVPVVTIIAEGTTPSRRLAFIGQDATAAGAQIGRFIAERMKGTGKLGVITGYFGAAQHTQRMNGALDYLKANAPRIATVGPFENQDKAETAYSIVQDMLASNPDLRMVYVTAGGPYGAAKAIKDLGLTGKVGIVGFDHTPDNVQYLKTGEIVGLLDQAPFRQAFDASVILYNFLVAGRRPPTDTIRVEGKLITEPPVESTGR